MKRGNVMTKSDDLIIWIMNVGRGLSIMIKTPQNYCSAQSELGLFYKS